MIEPDVTRPSLVIRLREPGDEAAWADFVQIYTPLIYHFARKRGLQDADAADVSQEVLRAVVRAIQKFEYDPGKGRFRGWLQTITRNKLNDFYHARQRLPPTMPAPLTELLPSAGPWLAESEEWDREYQRRLFDWAAEKTRQEVQARTWEAFRLTAIEGQTAEVVAAALGLSVGAVYVARSRVTTRLRQLILAVADEPPEMERIGAPCKSA